MIVGFVVSNNHTGSFKPRWNSDVVNVFDLSGTLRNQIQVGRNPSAITAAGSSLWVTNQDDKTVSHIDLTTGRTQVITSVGDAPAGVTLGDGRAWVVSTTNGQNGFPNTGTVTPVNPATYTATTPFSAGQQAGGIAYGDGRIWVAATLESQLYSFDPAHPGAPQRIDVGTAPTGIAVTSKAVWVTNAGDESVSEIEPGSGQPLTRTPFTVGVDPVAVAVGQSGVWVANHLSGTVTHIDPRTGNVTNLPVGGGPSGVAVTDDAVWVTTEYSGALVRIDPATNKVSRPILVPGAPRAIAVDGDRLYVASATSYQGHTGGQLRIRVAAPSVGPGYPIVDATWDADDVTYFIRNATTNSLISNALAPGPAGGSLVPDLAESVPSVTPGKTQYEFTLRPDLRYSNGERVLADDVRTSFQRALVEDRGDYFQSPLEAVVGAPACINTSVRKPCDLSRGIETDNASRTVRIFLSHPDPQFLSWSQIPIVPSDTRTRTFQQVLKVHVPVVGTGPYRVGTMDWPSRIELVRNNYFRPRPGEPQSKGYPDSIVIEVNPRPSPQDLVDLEKDSIDILDDQDLSLAGVQQAVSAYPIVKRDFGTEPLLSYAFLNNKMPPFNNLEARRALNYAVDRASALQQRAAAVDGTVTCQVIPPGFTGYHQFCPYTRDPAPTGAGPWTGPALAKARSLVRRSGTLGERVTVWPSSSPFHAPDGYFVQLLNKIGYHAELHAAFKTNNDYDAAVAKGHAQIGMLVSSSGGFDGGGFISEWTCNAPQVAHNYCNHHFDALYRREVHVELTNPQRAHDILARLDRILVSQAALVPISTESSFVMVSAKVGGWSTSQGGNLLGQLWVR
jgi:YVTN family beta-propeller protein